MKARGARITYCVCAGERRAHRELVTLHGSGSATLQTESAAKGIRPMRLKMVADSACEATLHETFRLRLWRRLCSSALFPRKLSLSKTYLVEGTLRFPTTTEEDTIESCS